MQISLGICPYCNQPIKKSELGMLLAVHPEHQAGTRFWAKWYRKERAAGRRHTDIGDLLHEICDEKAPNVNAGLAAMHAMQKQERLDREMELADKELTS